MIERSLNGHSDHDNSACDRRRHPTSDAPLHTRALGTLDERVTLRVPGHGCIGPRASPLLYLSASPITRNLSATRGSALFDGTLEAAGRSRARPCDRSSARRCGSTARGPIPTPRPMPGSATSTLSRVDRASPPGRRLRADPLGRRRVVSLDATAGGRASRNEAGDADADAEITHRPCTRDHCRTRPTLRPGQVSDRPAAFRQEVRNAAAPWNRDGQRGWRAPNA